jgi:hypothetical protein
MATPAGGATFSGGYGNSNGGSNGVIDFGDSFY